jgi:hypothetical protein
MDEVMKSFWLFVNVVSLVAGPCLAQPNLIVNGGAETGSLAGWTDALGNGFGTVQPSAFNAVEGTWVFTGGVTGPSGPLQNEIYQDVDVSAFAADIDDGIVSSDFAGWGRSAAAAGSHDDASMFVEFRSGSGSVLAVQASGAIVPFNTWVQVQDSRTVPAGTRRIRVRLHGVRTVGASTDAYFDALSLSVGPTEVAVDDGRAPAFPVFSCFPNPFNPRTTVSFTLLTAGPIQVAIYDTKGRMVALLIDGSLAAGAHTVDWDGRDAHGTSMPSGTYLCRLAAPWGTETRKMGLVR